MEAATTTQPQQKVHSLVHFEIPASDPAKVSRFYEQLFGWKFNKWQGSQMDYWLISHKDAAENDTMGGLFKRNAPNEGFLNYFSVRSIDESVNKATSNGAQVVTAKQNPQRWILRGPQGPGRKYLRPLPVHRQNVAHRTSQLPTSLFFI